MCQVCKPFHHASLIKSSLTLPRLSVSWFRSADALQARLGWFSPPDDESAVELTFR